MSELTIYGFGFSPFVRKTLVVLREKQIEHKHIPASPMDEQVAKLHPMKKIPVMTHGDVSLPDSSVIAFYLEKVFPETPLLPLEPASYGKALWFDEYADSAMIQKLLAPTVFEINFGHLMQGREIDQERIEKAKTESMAEVCSYLESELADQDYLVDNSFTIADISVASVFQSLKGAEITVDSTRFPKLGAYLKRIHERPSFSQSSEAELQELKIVSAKFKEKMSGR